MIFGLVQACLKGKPENLFSWYPAYSTDVKRIHAVHFTVLTPSGLKNLFAMSSEKPNVGASPTAAGS